MKSERNKTIDFPLSEGAEYLSGCLRYEDCLQGADLTDRIIIGDSLKIMPCLKKGSVDLMIADPPYNINKDFNGAKFRKVSCEEYEEYTEEWVSLAEPLLKKNASVYVCCGWESSGAVERVLRRHFIVRNRITWQREKGRGALSNWKQNSEDIWFATCSDDYTFNVDAVKERRRVIAPYRKDGVPKDWAETENGKFRDSCPSNFWDDISVPYWSMPENTAHPTQKPEKLIAKLILAGSDEGDLCFDPFLGSGTTAVTALKLKRHYLGIEQNEQYAAWAGKRLENAAKDPGIQGYTDGVFWERNTAGLQARARKEKQ